jgi:hypothetical protein
VARTFDATDLEVDGEVLLRGARVGGALTLDRARLIDSGSEALTADGVTLDGGLFGHDLVAEGRVRLPDARVGRRLVLSGARLSDPGGVALEADRLRVDGAAALDKGFHAEGQVSLRSATIGGTLFLHGARLEAPGDIVISAPGQVALECREVRAAVFQLTTRASVDGTGKRGGRP